jgi:hypothetical protein
MGCGLHYTKEALALQTPIVQANSLPCPFPCRPVVVIFKEQGYDRGRFEAHWKNPGFPSSLIPAPEREPDMAGQQQETGACRRFSQTGRRPSLKTGTLLILVGLWLTASLAAAPAPAAPQNTPLEKGKNLMPQAAAASVKEVAPLDKSQPSRVETFTFGLG